MQKRNEFDVLVVGAGPVGLFLAGEILRRGHSCALVERNARPSMHSKALAIMPRTIEMFERAGISETFLSEVNRISGVRVATPRGESLVSFERMPTRYPFVSIVPQWKTEALLAERLQQLRGSVRYGDAFEAYEEDADGVRATIGNAAGSYEVRARFIVGCDGVSSSVREQASITFAGRSYPEYALLADVPVETSASKSKAIVYIDRSAIVTCFPMNADMWRIVLICPRERFPQNASRGWLQSQIDRARLPGTLTGEPLWSSRFRVHRRVARQLRKGNLFLAGDAAHALSPVGGQGMNIGLEDAWALARVFSAVLSGKAPAGALDSYECGRLPIAHAVVRHTDLLLRALAHPHPVMCLGREYFAPRVVGIPVLQKPRRSRVAYGLIAAARTPGVACASNFSKFLANSAASFFACAS